MKTLSRREALVEYQTHIFRTHDNEEIEIPLNCIMYVYRGTNDNDDPSECSLESCVIAENCYSEKGIIAYIKKSKIELTEVE